MVKSKNNQNQGGGKNHVDDKTNKTNTDCTTRSLTSKGRNSSPPFITFYQNLTQKSIVDPLALLAFILAAIPVLLSVLWAIYPIKLDITPDKYITLKIENYTLPSGQKEGIVRITALFSFQNHHPKSKTKVENITATLHLGKKQSFQKWSQFIHSYENPSDTNKLILTYIKNANQFLISANEIVEKEVYFAPIPGEVLAPLKNGITKNELNAFVDKGNTPCIKFSVEANGESRDFSFIPERSSKISQYLKLDKRDWTVSKWKATNNCS